MERNPTLRRVFLARISPLAAAGWATLAVVVPTALRWAIDDGASGMPFLTYYPAVVLAALFLGWRWAAGVALVSAVIANRVFRATPLLFYEGPREAVLVGVFLLSCAVLVWAGSTARRLVRELEAAKVREETLNHELLHRVKNMLATVNAVAVLTARHTPPEHFVRALDGRMRALERATGLLGTEQKGQCDLHRLIADALEPFARRQRVHGRGAGVRAAARFVRAAGAGAARAVHQRRQARRAARGRGAGRPALDDRRGRRARRRAAAAAGVAQIGRAAGGPAGHCGDGLAAAARAARARRGAGRLSARGAHVRDQRRRGRPAGAGEGAA